MTFPAGLRAALLETLAALGDRTDMRSARSLGGGCINNALRLETGQGVYLLKWNSDPLPGMFAAEARGLELLGATHTVRVPAVLGFADAAADRPAFIVLEWLEGGSSGSQEQFGRELAALHRAALPYNPPAYGLDANNYIGSSVQFNRWEPDWPTFFADCRLKPQMALAQRNGYLPPERQRRLERLMARLPDLLANVPRQPALIHGDLWGGNVIPGPSGPALIDPAVYYADREAEIAFTELFGGFSARFYSAYHEAWPLDPGYSHRRDLYNLYHLLNHLNLFGQSYAPQVDAILKSYL